MNDNNNNTQIINNNNNLDANNNNLLFKESNPSQVNNYKKKFSQDKFLYQSYFYSNKNTILSVFVMSYEEQLQKAITKGNLELSGELIQLGCNLNLQKNRRLPLGIACEYNYYDIVELLLKVSLSLFVNFLFEIYFYYKNGADVNKFDFFDQTALFYAINSADLNIIKLLIHYGN
jgi:ankyrin repeat protein